MNENQISLLAAFTAARVEYAVVGGMAGNAHGYVRATHDLDIFIRPTEENARAAFEALLVIGVPLSGLVPSNLLDDEQNLRFGPEENHIIYLLRAGDGLRSGLVKPCGNESGRIFSPFHLEGRPYRKQAPGGKTARPRRRRRVGIPHINSRELADPQPRSASRSFRLRSSPQR